MVGFDYFLYDFVANLISLYHDNVVGKYTIWVY